MITHSDANKKRFSSSKALTIAYLLSVSGLSAAAVINGDMKAVSAGASIEATILSSSDSKDQWYSYTVAMEPNNGMPCCLISQSNASCNLDKRSTAWSAQNSNGKDASSLEILFKTEDGKTSDLILAGDACRVDAGRNTVFRVENINEKTSLDFLTQLSDSANHGLASKATAAIALHKGKLAQSILENFADNSKSKKRRDGIFWLGEARNQAGYQALLKVINEDRRSRDDRAHAVFALSLNHAPEALPALRSIAMGQSTTHLQGEAIFWLAQHHKSEAEPIIAKILQTTSNRKLKKKTVFALAQIKSESSWAELIRLAESSDDPEVKLEAIFWLSQDRNRDPSTTLLALTNETQSRIVQDKAVFSLSQLGHELATPALINLSKTTNSRFVKKQALFWLGQSSDPNALDYLEQLLTAS